MADLRSYIIGLTPADNLAAPSSDIQFVGAFPHWFDGANWDRAQGTAADGLLVNLGTNNDVTVTSGSITADTELPAAAALTDDFANPTAPGVAAFGMVWDGATWDRFPGTSTDGALVNLGGNNDVTVTSGNITADTELPAAAALTDNFANPTAPGVGAFLMLWDGATWDRAPGNAATGLSVSVGAAANPVISPQTSAALAAGSAVALTTAEAGSKRLAKVIAWSSVAFKVTLTTVDNAVESGNLAVGGAAAHGTWEWNTPALPFVALGATAGLDAFRVNITNLDDQNAADVFATFYYQD